MCKQQTAVSHGSTEELYHWTLVHAWTELPLWFVEFGYRSFALITITIVLELG